MHGITDVPVAVASIAQLEGVEVRTEYLPVSEGSLTPAQGSFIIRVSSALPPCRRQFTIAHELGHLILHRMHQQFAAQDPSLSGIFAGTRSNGYRTEELFCNWFASRLLIPQRVSAEIADWQWMAIERLFARAQELGVCLDALIWHCLEEVEPKGGALRFRIRPKGARRSPPNGMNDFELVLTQALFPRRREWIDVGPGIVVPESAEIYQVVSVLYPRIHRHEYVPELLYPELDLEFGGVRLRRAALLKPIDWSIWVLVLPEDYDVDKLPLKRTMSLQRARPVQLSLFGREEADWGSARAVEPTNGMTDFKPA